MIRRSSSLRTATILGGLALLAVFGFWGCSPRADAGWSVTFVEACQYPQSRLPLGGGWAPDGSSFALLAPTGIAVHDTGAYLVERRFTLWGYFTETSWSPNSDRLAGVGKSVEIGTVRDDWFAIAGVGSNPIEIPNHAKLVHPFWLPDGSLHALKPGDGSTRMVADAATTSASPSPSSLPILVPSLKSEPLRVLMPMRDAPPSSAALQGYPQIAIVPGSSDGNVRLLGRSPSLSLQLAIRLAPRSRAVLLDTMGSLVADLTAGPARLRSLQLLSFAAHDSLLLGTQKSFDETDAPKALVAVSLSGLWTGPVRAAPRCTGASASTRGGWVLIQSGGTVHLGKLVVERAK